MKPFVFPISGVHGPCCKGNLNTFLNDVSEPTFFKFSKIDISANYSQLMVEVESDNVSEEEVRRYISQALQGTDYKLVVESAQKFWIQGVLGLISGTLILVFSLTMSISLPFQMLFAAMSCALTLILGAESFRKAINGFGKPGMDSLFVLSTSLSLVISLAAFFIPGLPMMFEAPLLIFGFRHLGIAIKKSIYDSPFASVQYQHLVSKTANRAQDFFPGERISLSKGEIVPLDGWLISAQENAELKQASWLDVSKIGGTHQPQPFYPGDQLVSGMVAKTPIEMQIGCPYKFQFFAKKPSRECPKEEIWIYPVGEEVAFCVRSDKNGAIYKKILKGEDYSLYADLKDKEAEGEILKKEIHQALLQETIPYLPEQVKNRFSQVILNQLPECFVTKTHSYLEQLSQELETLSLQRDPIQDKMEEIAGYFIPIVITVALISGAVIAYYFPVVIALSCIVSILVSACPCTFGFIAPLVMEVSRIIGKKAGFVFTQPDAIQTISEIDTVMMDIHGTAAQTDSQVQLFINEREQTSAKNAASATPHPPFGHLLPVSGEKGVMRGALYVDIERQLALIERQALTQFGVHHTGQAIYNAVKGDKILQSSVLPTDLPTVLLKQHQGGLEAHIDGKEYLLGNADFVKKFGYQPSQNSYLYFLEKNSDGYQELAKIKIKAPLREDAARTVAFFHQRGLTVDLLTGEEEETAKEYAAELKNIHQVHFGCSAQQKAAKVKEWQDKGHKVLLFGDGVNDALAIKAAHASIAMKHQLGDEGILYLAKARILNQKMLAAVDIYDVAKAARSKINVSLCLSLLYNLTAVMLTNILLLTCGIVLHPGVGAALMVMQVALIVLYVLHFLYQPLPTAQPKKSSFGLWKDASSTLIDPNVNLTPAPL